MRLLLFLLLACFTNCAFAGTKSEASLKAVVLSLDSALLQKDTALLERILSPKLQYGHSNAWIQTKEQVKADLYNGKIVYRSIRDNGKGPQIVIDGNTGLVRENIFVDVLLNDEPISLNLTVLQVWVFNKGAWKLVGRQSAKIERR